jgi:hypothetical protein
VRNTTLGADLSRTRYVAVAVVVRPAASVATTVKVNSQGRDVSSGVFVGTVPTHLTEVTSQK